MVVKEDGTKWACQPCLKGHRVSGCTHTDRELTLVPKKGRPVTQCQHCRLERKKRSAHVRCDCGEAEKPHHSKEKCIHLREAEERAKAGLPDEHHLDRDLSHLAAVAEEQGCCCHHGGKCTCTIQSTIQKREGGDDALAPHGPAVKPRLEKTNSDGNITVFVNGHHKPVHRKNHAAHEAGMPYKIPTPRINGEQKASALARRSVDSLALDRGVPFQPMDFAEQPSAPYIRERRLSKSEQHSPKIPPLGEKCSGLGDEKLASIDFSDLSQWQTNSSLQSATNDVYYSPMDPSSGANDSAFDPWSAFPSADSTGMPNNNPFGVWPTAPDTAGMTRPALTAASSGTQSEIDEIPPMDESYGFAMPSIQEDTGDFDFGEFVSGNSPQFNRRSLPPGFFGNVDFSMGGTNDEMTSSSGIITTSDRTKPQETSPIFGSVWQTSSMPSIVTVPQRALGNLHNTARPQSRSVGSYDLPNDDVIKQLFPDLDTSACGYAPSDSPQLNMSMDRHMGGLPRKSVTSAPMDFERMDDIDGFTSQSWVDGSVSIPNDTFGTPYNLEQDYSSSDFSTNWSQ